MVYVKHSVDKFFPDISDDVGYGEFAAFYNPHTRKIVSRIGFQPANVSFALRQQYAIDQINWRWEKYYACIRAAARDVDQTLACISVIVRAMLIIHPFSDWPG